MGEEVVGAEHPQQAEEQEHVTFANALPFEVRLRRAALAEQARPIAQEHGVMMAEVGRPQFASAGGGYVFAQSQVAISRA